MENRALLIQKTIKAGILAKGSRLQRFFHAPVRYGLGLLFSKWLYRFTWSTWRVSSTTFFGEKITLALPAGLDIFLLGLKSHDSELRLARFLIRYLKEGAVFYDVGAHLGFFSLLATRLVGTGGKVYGFEASSEMAGYYRDNSKHVSNIQANHLAVSNTNGFIRFFEFPVLYSEYNSVDQSQYATASWFKSMKPDEVEVACTTLDSFSQKEHACPDIIKIDVEGAEQLVLEGSKELLAGCKPVVVLEFIPPSSGQWQDCSHGKALLILFDAGYELYTINNKGGLEKTKPDDYLLSGFDSDNLVCIHPDNFPTACLAD